MTLDQQMKGAGGRATGFDYLRIVLAVSILVFHTLGSSLGEAGAEPPWATPLRVPLTMLLPMFFALSGFLVASSLERQKNIASFLFLRLIRIFPALGVEILISAFLIGAVVTTLPLDQYFTHPEFFSYFTNMVGLIQYELPGVFETNPLPYTVNLQLWTIPFELECYMALAVLSLLGLYKRPLLLAIVCALVTAYFAWKFFTAAELPPFNVPGRPLVGYFLIGVLLFRARTWVPFNGWLFAASLILTIICASMVGGGLLLLVPLSYVTVYLGLTAPPLIGVLRTGDYSYGIFLYHFAIQQFLVHSFTWAAHPALNALASLTLATGVAVLSWHFVEKPFMRLRKFTATIDAYVDRLVKLFRRSPKPSHDTHA